MKSLILEDTTILLGENAKENWLLANPNSTLYEKYTDKDTKAIEQFIWLHLAKFPSGHGIILSDNVSHKLLKTAGIFCAQNTKYRNLQHLKISFTPLKNINLGEKCGEVFFTSNRKVSHLKI